MRTLAFHLVLAAWAVASGGTRSCRAQHADLGPRNGMEMQRRFDGWRKVFAAATPSSGEVRFYQAAGSLSDGGLPALPDFNANAGVPPGNSSTAIAPPELPPSFPAAGGSSAAIALPAAPPVLPDVPSNGLRSSTGTGRIPSAGIEASASAASQRGVPAQTAQLSSAGGGRSGNPGNVAPAGLRGIPSSAGGGGSKTGGATPGDARSEGRLDPRSIATGLPYVTPAPGRYPTSPLNPTLFQTAAYQQAVLPPGAPGGTAPSANVLPQYAPPPAVGSTGRYAQPGIYPTSCQSAYGVVPQPAVPSTGAVGGNFVPPTLTPNWNPNLYAPNNAGFRPLISLGQENYNVVLGRGIIGQPTVYVPGQHIRNFLRYLSP